MEPKNEQRAYNLRRANRKMPRRRLDIPVEQIDYKNPEVLTLFTTCLLYTSPSPRDLSTARKPSSA